MFLVSFLLKKVFCFDKKCSPLSLTFFAEPFLSIDPNCGRKLWNAINWNVIVWRRNKVPKRQIITEKRACHGHKRNKNNNQASHSSMVPKISHYSSWIPCRSPPPSPSSSRIHYFPFFISCWQKLLSPFRMHPNLSKLVCLFIVWWSVPLFKQGKSRKTWEFLSPEKNGFLENCIFSKNSTQFLCFI